MKRFIMLLSVIFTAICLSACSSDSPEKVVNKMLNACRKGDYEEMFKLSNLSPGKQKESAELLYNNMTPDQMLKSFKITDSEISVIGNEAIVTVCKTYVNGEEMTTQYPLVRINKKWMVDMLNMTE